MIFVFKHKIFVATENIDIEVQTINMRSPAAFAEERHIRKAVISSEIHQQLITKEAFLRKLAYKNTTIKTDESFFDDSDMKSDYYLVISSFLKLYRKS